MGATGLTGQQALSPSGEMRVFQGANRVLGTSYLGESGFYGSGQGRRSLRVAHSREQNRCPGVPRLHELLL